MSVIGIRDRYGKETDRLAHAAMTRLRGGVPPYPCRTERRSPRPPSAGLFDQLAHRVHHGSDGGLGGGAGDADFRLSQRSADALLDHGAALDIDNGKAEVHERHGVEVDPTPAGFFRAAPSLGIKAPSS